MWYEAGRGGRVCYFVRLVGGYRRRGDVSVLSSQMSKWFDFTPILPYELPPSPHSRGACTRDSSNPPKLCVISAAIQSPSVRVVRPFRSQSRNVRGACSVAVTEAEAFMQRYWIITPPPPPPTLQSVLRGMAFDTRSGSLSLPHLQCDV